MQWVRRGPDAIQGLLPPGAVWLLPSATAALKAGVSPKIISERLGHATAAFTLQVYSHVIPGLDEAAASSVAALILGPADPGDETAVRNSVRIEPGDQPETN